MLKRGCAERNGVLLPVAFCIGQQELWRELERLKQTAALANGALKQAFGKRRGHQDADRYRPGGLTGDGDTLRVAAKGSNIPLDPLECGDLVHQAVVSGRVVRGLARQFRKGKKPEWAKPIGDGDNDHAFLCEPVAPVERHGSWTR